MTYQPKPTTKDLLTSHEQTDYDVLVETLLESSVLDPFIPEDRNDYRQLVAEVENEGHQTKGIMYIYRSYALIKQSREEYDIAKQRAAQERFLRLFPSVEGLKYALTICITRVETDIKLTHRDPFASSDPLVPRIQRLKDIMNTTSDQSEKAKSLLPFRPNNISAATHPDHQATDITLQPHLQTQITQVRDTYGDQDAEYEMRVQIETIISNLWPDTTREWRKQMEEIVPLVILQYHLLEHYTQTRDQSIPGDADLTTVGLREFAEYITIGGHDGHTALDFLLTKGLGYFTNGPGSTALDTLPRRILLEKVSHDSQLDIAAACPRESISLGVMQLIALAYGSPPQIVEQYPNAPLQNYSALIIGWFGNITKRFIHQERDGSPTDKLVDIAHKIDKVFESHSTSQGDTYFGQHDTEESTEILQMINDAITDPTNPDKVSGNIAKKLGVSDSVLMEIKRMIKIEETHPPILTSADVEMILLQYFIGTQDNVSDAIRLFIINYCGDITIPVTARMWSQYYSQIRQELPKLAQTSYFIANRDQEIMRRGLNAMQKSLDQHSQP